MYRLLIIFLFICPSAFAAYTTMTIEGVKQANGVWTTAGVMDTSGFVRTTSAVTVAGTVRNLPITASVDVPAASRLLKLGSKALGPIALAAAAYDVYDWATSGDITSTGDQWILKSDFSSDYGYTLGSEWFSSLISGAFSSPDSACKAYSQSKKGVYLWSPNYKVVFAGANSYECTLYSSDYKFQVGSTALYRRPCSTGSDIQSCKTPTAITDSDFLKLPDPSLPILVSGWLHLPSLSGLPVPITGVHFTPYPEWMGDPYFKDGNWFRDRMDVSPAPTKSQPTRVKVDIGPVKIEGATDPNVTPDTNTGGGSSTPKEKPTFCEANPQSIACAEMGSLEQEPFDPVEKPFQITPQNPWGSGDAQCPAPKVMQLSTGSTATLSYQPACDFFRGVRPAVLALAFLAALYIALGIPVGKGD